jgi:transposase-like protein
LQSLSYVTFLLSPYPELTLKEVTTDLKKIYTAATEEMAHFELKQFGAKWDNADYG